MHISTPHLDRFLVGWFVPLALLLACQGCRGPEPKADLHPEWPDEYDTGVFKVRQGPGDLIAPAAYLWREDDDPPCWEVWALMPTWQAAGSSGAEALYLERIPMQPPADAAAFKQWVQGVASGVQIRFHKHRVEVL